MIRILREYTEENTHVVEYTKDGTTVSHTVKTPIPVEFPPTEPEPSIEDKINYLYFKSIGVIA